MRRKIAPLGGFFLKEVFDVMRGQYPDRAGCSANDLFGSAPHDGIPDSAALRLHHDYASGAVLFRGFQDCIRYSLAIRVHQCFYDDIAMPRKLRPCFFPTSLMFDLVLPKYARRDSFSSVLLHSGLVVKVERRHWECGNDVKKMDLGPELPGYVHRLPKKYLRVFAKFRWKDDSSQALCDFIFLPDN